MDDNKDIKLQLIQHILACEDKAVLQTTLQLLQSYTKMPNTDSDMSQTRQQALLEGSAIVSSTSNSYMDDNAVQDLQQSINDIFGS